MLLGFGFGSPLVSLLMLIVTSALSYGLFRWFAKGQHAKPISRSELREYYYEQRRRAKEMMEEFDISDEEIEQRIEEQINKKR